MAVAPEQRHGLFATKPVDALVADTEDSEHQLRALGRGARPHRARAGRDHRHGHLRRDRRGHRRRRARDRPLVRPGRRDLRLLGAVLRRAGLHHPGRGQRLHLLLRDDGRADRVDHRLGPDPRVLRLGRGRRGRLGPVLQRAARQPVRRHAAGVDRRPARRWRRGQPAGGVHRARHHRGALLRHPRERARQHDHGDRQARDPRARPRARRHRVHQRQPHAVHAGGHRRHGDGRVGDLLRLHRLRRRLDVR